jgi:hypothetical protein
MSVKHFITGSSKHSKKSFVDRAIIIDLYHDNSEVNDIKRELSVSPLGISRNVE